MTSLRFLTITLLALALAGCNVQLNNGSQDDSQGSTSSAASEPEPDSNSGSSEENDAETRSATLHWSSPFERVNGMSLEHNEIGGYEIRYKVGQSEQYSVVVIDDPVTQRYHFDDLPRDGDYEIKIAVFDVNGLYSDFVNAQP